MTTHQHTWAQIDEPTNWACTDCPATATTCTDCNRILNTHGRVCDDCTSEARTDLYETRDLYLQLPDIIAATAGLHAVRYDRGTTTARSNDTTIIGGAAFVLAGPGNSADRGLQLGRGETSEAIAHLSAAEQTDPPSVLAVLTGWEDAWRIEQGQPAATRTSVDAATDYLVQHVNWAAQHSGRWTEHRADIRALRNRLRSVTGTSQPPVTEAAPCVHCGGTITRSWSDEGLADVRQCQQCGTSWPSEERLRHTNHLRILAAPTTDPDTLVTAEQARLALPDLKRNTLNQILKRDRERLEAWREHQTGPIPEARVPEMGRTVRGECLYLLGDIAQLITPPQEATA